MLRTILRYFIAVPLLAVIFIGLTIFLELFLKTFIREGDEMTTETIIETEKISIPLEEVVDDQQERQVKILLPGEKSLTKETNDFLPPLDQIQERLTKKKFGTFVSPENSPVSPERFFGYHNAIDLETFPGELNETVAVRSVCDGKLLSKRTASGYGGVVVQSCTLNDSPITVVYGHLKLTSIKVDIGARLQAGQQLGVLGKGMSAETGGERKHLHLGFHKGSLINIQGYVQNKTTLLNWIDPCLYLCKN
ncbi:M23 family metallopeptidase [bacterium]|nr:M23 family metallopeptidase [bacterium]